MEKVESKVEKGEKVSLLIPSPTDESASSHASELMQSPFRQPDHLPQTSLVEIYI
jgi:hypothetical protein